MCRDTAALKYITSEWTHIKIERSLPKLGYFPKRERKGAKEISPPPARRRVLGGWGGSEGYCAHSEAPSRSGNRHKA